MSKDARVYNLDDYRCPTEHDDNVRDQVEAHDEFAQAGRLKKAAMMAVAFGLVGIAAYEVLREAVQRE